MDECIGLVLSNTDFSSERIAMPDVHKVSSSHLILKTTSPRFEPVTIHTCSGHSRFAAQPSQSSVRIIITTCSIVIKSINIKKIN